MHAVFSASVGSQSTNVDDSTVGRILQMRQCSLRAMKGTIQNNSQGAAPIGTAHVGQGRFFANGGIVHQNIQASKTS